MYSQTCVNGHLRTTATSEQRPPPNNGHLSLMIGLIPSQPKYILTFHDQPVDNDHFRTTASFLRPKAGCCTQVYIKCVYIRYDMYAYDKYYVCVS